MLWVLVVTAAAVAVALFAMRGRKERWRRDAVQRDNGTHCPHCDLEVSKSNPMVNNVSGRRMGLHSHDRWCQVCESNAEQHVIHRS